MTVREVELVEAESLSPSVRRLRFACVDGAPLTFVPGQWVNLWLTLDGARHKRAYSIAGVSPPDAPHTLELAVTRVEDGPVSSALHSIPVGSRCELDGPHGLFTREGLRSEPALFVGTGTGVSPLRAMLHEALALPTRVPITLLFGCRRQHDILFRSEWEALSAAHPELRVLVTLSRADGSWTGLQGYVQDHLDLALSGSRPHVFICGLTPMVKAVRAALKGAHGYDRRRIHSERFD